MKMTRKIRRAWLRGKPEWAKRYPLKQRLRKEAKIIEFTNNKGKLHKYSRYLVAGVMLACLGVGQGVASAAGIEVVDAYTDKVVKENNVYNIYNQQVNSSGSAALNKFKTFTVNEDEIANLQLGNVQRQINLVSDRIDINGVVNAFKNGQIGGDVFFFSDYGIAVGAKGVINVGSLTLGTDVIAGQSIYNNWDYFSSMSNISKAEYVTGIGDIAIDGSINSIGDVIIGGRKITVGQDADINTSASFGINGVPSSDLTTVDDYRANFMNLNGIEAAANASKTSTGDIVLYGGSVEFKGDAYTAGGNFTAFSANTISFTGTENNKAQVITNGGDISVSVQRSERADVEINIVDSNLDAEDKTIDANNNKKNNNNGNVDIVASTVSRTISWAMEGNSATVTVDDSKIVGDNVNVSAIATITGTVGDDDTTLPYSDEEIQERLDYAVEKNSTPIWDIIASTGFYGPDLRTLVSATDVEVESNVNIINDSDVKAIGGNKVNNLTDENGNALHGNLNVQSIANSRVITTGLGLINISAIVGISDVTSNVNINGSINGNGSNLYAAKDMSITAYGDNTVNLSYLDLSMVDVVQKLRGTPSVGFNWAELSSDVGVNVDNKSTLKSKDSVTVYAESIRNLSSDTVAGGDTDKLGIVASVAMADTNAEANVAGKIYTDGAINVSAKNSVAQVDGYYTADTSIAESMSGDTFLGKPVVNLMKTMVNKAIQSISHYNGFDVNGVPGQGGDWGMNASTAFLDSENDATASVTGIVRSFNGENGAGSLNVYAENISRNSIGASSYQNELTNIKGDTINSKDVGISLAVNIGLQNNSATAYIGGDIKTAGKIDVKAITKIPWQTTFSDLTLSGIVSSIFSAITDPNLNLGSLTDSWAQASATTNKIGGAGAVGVLEYVNEAEAYVDKDAIVVAGNDLKIEALTNAETVNFSGNITSPLTMLPIAFWEGKDNLFKPDLWGVTGEGAALGGTALAVRQKNIAKAYIADSDTSTPVNGSDVVTINGSVQAANIDIDAKNKSVNVGVLASGGTSETVALDGTVGVFRIENEVDAHIGQANVQSGNVTVDALDESYNINLAGVVASGSTNASIGATIAYNHIDRDTSAYINGNVTATDAITISAANEGLIVASSLAGAVTYNNRLDNVDNAGGSTGTHVNQETVLEDGTIMIEMDVTPSNNDMGDLTHQLLNDGGSNIFGNDAEIDTGEDVVEDVGEQDQGTNVAAAQTGFSVAANVAVNRILDNANAYVAPTVNVKENASEENSKGVNSVINPYLVADYVRVNSHNDSEIVAANVTATLTTTAGKASTGVAGSFMYNSITSSNNAYVDNAMISVSGNPNTTTKEVSSDTGTNTEVVPIDEALTISAQNLEKIVNVSLSGSVAPKGNDVVGQISVNRIDNTNNSYIKASDVIAAEKITVNAVDEAEIQSYTGALSVTGGAVGIGAAIGVQDIDGKTTAKIEDTQITGANSSKGGGIEVTADENSDITSIVATGSVGINTFMTAAFSVSANDVDTTTKAYIDSDENIKAAAIKVAARNMANSTIGVGQLSVGKNAIGIASAIALSSNDVEAYIKGDDNGDSTVNSIEADSISVTATNIYNGSSEDLPANLDDDKYKLNDKVMESLTTAKTVAIGGAVGTGTVAGAGSVTVNIINNTTKAHIDAGKYTVDNNIDVDAQSSAKMFGLAGGLSIGRGVGVGAAVDTQLLDTDTQAYIGDNVNITQAGDIAVEAQSNEEITSVAVIASGGSYFAGAAAANAHSVDVNTSAYIGADDSNSGTGNATSTVYSNLTATGDISVTASDDVDLASNAGSAGVQIGSGGVAGSLSAAVEVLNKDVSAYINKANVNTADLTIQAQNTGDVITTANGIALAINEYGGALTGTASESIVGYNTAAYISGENSAITADDIYINANSDFGHIGEAAAIAGSTIGSVGLGNDTTVFTATTNAYIDNDVDVTSADVPVSATADVAEGSGSDDESAAEDDTTISSHSFDGIEIASTSNVDITSAVASGAGAVGVAATGAVGVNVIDTSTNAYIGNLSNIINKNGAISISAVDTTVIDGGSGGLAGAVAGGGAAVNVNAITKKTTAYIGEGAVIQNNGETSISAVSNEEILNYTVQASGGAGALAGAVGVHDLDIVTMAYTDTGSKIIGVTDVNATAEGTGSENVTDEGTGNDDNIIASAGNISITATHNVAVNSTAIGATLGAVAVGAAVDVGNIISQTNAYVGNNSTIKTTGDLSVIANELDKDIIRKVTDADGKEKEETKKMGSTVASTAVSGISVSGSVSVYTFGSGMNDADAAYLNTNTNGTSHTDKNNNTYTFDDWLNEQLNQSQTKEAMSKYGDNEVAGTVGSALLKRDEKLSVGVTTVETHSVSTAGTAAKVGSNANIEADDITIKSNSNLYMNTSAGTGAGGGLAVGASVGVVNNNSVVNAVVDNGANINATNNVIVQADTISDLTGLAVTPAVGFIAGAAASLDLNSKTKTTTSIGDGANINGNDITIKASSTPILNAVATGDVVGAASVGLVTALVDSSDDTYVNIGDSVKLDADNDIDIEAEFKTPTNQYNAYVEAIAGSGGVLAGSVTVSQIDLDNDTAVTIGKAGTIDAKTLDILARHKDAINYKNISVAAVGFTGTGADNRVNITSDVKVDIGTTGTGAENQFTTTGVTTINAENISIKDWLHATSDDAVGEDDYNSLSAGASLAGGTGIVNETNITHNTDVNLGDVVIKANAASKNDNAIAIDAHSYVKSKDYQYIGTGALLEAAEIDDDNIVTANTNVALGSGTALYAGDTEKANDNFVSGDGESSESDNYVIVPAGGSLNGVNNQAGLGTYDATYVGAGRISVGARNDADLYSKTYVNTWGGSGIVGTTNDVTYTSNITTTIDGDAETANGDVRFAAGRDSDGAANVINVTADATLLNGTVVPISHTNDPTAVVNSISNLIIEGNSHTRSDADVYLQTNAGTITALGKGEVYDWAHAVGEIFDSTCWQTGSKSISTSTNVKVDGTIDTGIHRNQSITIDGKVVAIESNSEGALFDDVLWVTEINNTPGIGYKLENNQDISNLLSSRLEELRDLRAKYIADRETVEYCDAEISSIEAQMVVLGLGYYDVGNNDVSVFVEYGANTNVTKEYEFLLSDKATEFIAKIDDDIEICVNKIAENGIDPAQKAKYESVKNALIIFRTKLEEKIGAASYFANHNGRIENGKFYIGESEVNAYTVGTDGSYVFSYAPNAVSTTSADVPNKVELKDIEIKLGDIIVEGDNLYGEGNLRANPDATLNITNNSPNDLVINNIKTVTNRSTNEKIYEGANIIFNGVNVVNNNDITSNNLDETLNVGFTEIINNENSTNKSSFTINNLFDPGDYLTRELFTESGISTSAVSESEKLFPASDLIIAEGAQISNQNGSVTVNSTYGDVYNYGTINAASVSIQVTNGSYVQDYTDNDTIVNIGGEPGAIYEDKETLDETGIYANGNIVIKARYVNINSTIQSGRADWSLSIPEQVNPISVYWYEDNQKKTGTFSYNNGYMMLDGGDTSKIDGGIIYFTENDNTEAIFGSAYQHLSYDFNSRKFILDGITVTGGKIDITGTIMNTSSNGKGKIIAVDGFGSITITNSSDYHLEVRNINTGDGSEGEIKITDLDCDTGLTKRVTTYTRDKGTVRGEEVVYTYGNNGEATHTTNVISNTASYTPEDNYYIWQTGQDSSTITEYHYTDEDAVIWWKDGDFSDKDLEDMDVVKVTTGDKYQLAGGTRVATSIGEFYYTDQATGNKQLVEVNTVIPDAGLPAYDAQGNEVTINEVTINNDGHAEYVYTVVTSASEPFDERTETHRVWYTLWIVKEYDHWFKIQEGTTTITQDSLKANNPIGISFIGNEGSGQLTISSNSADVILNGMISNVAGTTTISAKDIVQGANGYIKTDTLNLNAKGNAGTDDSAIQTNASYLYGSAGDSTDGVVNGSFAVEVLNGGVNLGDIAAETTAYISATRDITQASGTNISAQRVELYSQSGSIGSSKDAIDIYAGAPTDGVKSKDYGLRAEANKGVYINNTNGDLYLDSVISTNGDVVLTTDGSFIDNNFTDTVDKDAATKIARWQLGQVLENEETTANLQKQLLISKAESKYNRFQALKNMLARDKDGNLILDADGNPTVVLSDTDKAALTKDGYDADEYVGKLNAEYQDLLAEGADKWTETNLGTYVDAINAKKASDTVMASAALTASDLGNHRFASADGVEFLTAGEKAEVLVGSARTKESLLYANGPGGLKEVTDTNLLIKAVPNIKGKNVSLNVGSSIGSSTTLTGTIPEDIASILKKAAAAEKPEDLTSDEKEAVALYEAYCAAERGDVVQNNDGTGTITITVANPFVVESSGALNVSANNGDVFLASEGNLTIDEITSGGEVRIKANGSIIGNTGGIASSGGARLRAVDAAAGNEEDIADGTITSAERVILESAQGDIKGITLIEKANTDGTDNSNSTEQHELIARAEGDISISKADDLVVDTIYSATGNVTLNVGETNNETTTAIRHNIVAYQPTDGVVLADDQTVNIKAINVNLLGVQNLGINDDKPIYIEISNGTLNADKMENMYVNLDGVLNGASVSAVNIDMVNLASITGGEFVAGEKFLLQNAAEVTSDDEVTDKGIISGGTFTGSILDVTNFGDITDGTITARTTANVANSGKINITNYGNIAGGTISAVETADVTNRGNISNGTIKGNMVDVTNTGNITGGTITAQTTADITNSGYMAKNTINGGTVTVESTGNIDGTQLHATADAADDVIIKVTSDKAVTKNLVVTANDAVVADSDADIDFASITAATATVSSDGSVSVGNADITGAATVVAGQNIGVYELDADSLVAKAGNDFDGYSINTKDVATVVAGHNIDVYELEAGSLEAKAGNDFAGYSINTVDVATVVAGQNIDVYELEADSLVAKASNDFAGYSINTKDVATVVAGNDIGVYEQLEAGSLVAKAGNDFAGYSINTEGVATVVAGNDIGVYELEAGSLVAKASNDFAGYSINTEGVATVVAGQNIDVYELEAGSLDAVAGNDFEGTTVAVSGDATVVAGTDITVETLNASSLEAVAGKDFDGTTVTVNGDATVVAGNDITVETLNASSLEAKAGKDFEGTTVTVSEDAAVVAGKDITVETLNAGSLEAVAGNNFDGTTISTGDGGTTITAGNDIVVSTQESTNSLNGVAVDTAPDSVGDADYSAAILTAKERVDDFNFADNKGDAVLSSTGDINLNAQGTIAVDTLVTNDGAVALTGNAIGIDDVQNTGSSTTQLNINGSQGEAAYYVGIGTSDDNPLLISQSAIQDLYVTAKDNVGLSDTSISGNGRVDAGKVRMEITENDGNGYSLHIGDIFVSNDNIDTTEPFAYTLDGVTLNGSHREATILGVAEDALYASEYAGKHAEADKEEDSEKHDTSITFDDVANHEQYDVM